MIWFHCSNSAGVFQDIRSTQQNEFLKERQEDEMDLSDEDNPDTGPNAKKRKNDIIQDGEDENQNKHIMQIFCMFDSKIV